jgi:DNA-binding NtrC family response regulator
VVSATHRDLDRMVADGRFREDLYYRLSTFPIALPPLRQRADDVALLAPALLARVAPARRLALGADALALLQAQPWPGNVRELRNLLERAALLCDGDTLHATQVAQALVIGRRAAPPPATDPAENPVAEPAAAPAAPPLRAAEQAALRAHLARHHGNRAALAAELGISERTLYRKLRALAPESGAAQTG